MRYLLLALAFVALVGCGGDGDDETPSAPAYDWDDMIVFTYSADYDQHHHPYESAIIAAYRASADCMGQPYSAIPSTVLAGSGDDSFELYDGIPVKVNDSRITVVIASNAPVDRVAAASQHALVHYVLNDPSEHAHDYFSNCVGL